MAKLKRDEFSVSFFPSKEAVLDVLREDDMHTNLSSTYIEPGAGLARIIDGKISDEIVGVVETSFSVKSKPNAGGSKEFVDVEYRLKNGDVVSAHSMRENKYAHQELPALYGALLAHEGKLYLSCEEMYNIDNIPNSIKHAKIFEITAMSDCTRDMFDLENPITEMQFNGRALLSDDEFIATLEDCQSKILNQKRETNTSPSINSDDFYAGQFLFEPLQGNEIRLVACVWSTSRSKHEIEKAFEYLNANISDAPVMA